MLIIDHRSCPNISVATTSAVKKRLPILEPISIASDLGTQKVNSLTYRKHTNHYTHMLCDFISQLLRMLIPADLVRQGFSPDDWKKVRICVECTSRL